MLKDLDRKERVSKIRAIANSTEVQEMEMYRDYYEGIHFVKSDITQTDYGSNRIYRVTTRSGIELYDSFTEEDKPVVKANWCSPIVETIGDYTRGVNDEIIITSEEKEDELKEIWKNNNLDLLTHEVAYEAGIYGKTYLRLKRQDKSSPIEVKQIKPTSVYENLNPITGERDSVIYWFVIDKEQAEKLYDIKIGSDQAYYFEEWTDETIHKYVDGVQVNEVKEDIVKDGNPYGFIPFFEVACNINKQSDISNVISLNDTLNLTMTYIAEILKYSAFPMLAPKGSFTETSPVLSKEQLQEVEISPRTIMPIPMERISGEGVDSSVLDHISQLEKDISIISGVPIKLLTAEFDGNLSGIALQRMLGSVLRQAEQRRNYIKTTLQEINNRIIELLGGKETETEITFPGMMRIDMNERLDEMLKKQTIGISKETIFKELGYDYAEEKERKDQEFEMEDRLMQEEEILTANDNKIDDKQGIQSNPKAGKTKGVSA